MEFRLRDFRSTLCTLMVNGDVTRLSLRTVQMRHIDPDTTKRFYADIERSNVGRQLRGVWRETAIRASYPDEARTIVEKHPVIDSRLEISGHG